MILLPDFVCHALDALTTAGYEAWVVGGAVRDALIEKEPKDYDIATNALPGQVKRIFKKTIDTGLCFGTVTVLIDGQSIEVTTFRTDGWYQNHRRPAEVRLAPSIRLDFARRDFTINAIAFHPQAGIYDPFDGQGDLKKRLIRTVGDANARFEEDALRILRAYRFCAQLDFSMEPSTFETAQEKSVLLEKISAERIRQELMLMVCSDYVERIIPLHIKHLSITHREQTKQITRLKKDPATRLAAYMYVNQLPCTLLLALKCSNQMKHDVKQVIHLLEGQIPDTKIKLKKLMGCFSIADVKRSFEIANQIDGKSTDEALKWLWEIQENREPYRIDMLAVKGNDLLGAGVGQGPKMKEMFDFLLEKVIINPDLNKKEILLELIQNEHNR